jgi:DNA-directed RNA polymerase specialized sigma24 family protein
MIIRISQNDDQEAFEILFKRYVDGLISFGNSFINTFEVVKEIVGDVFVKLWENRQMLPNINNLSSYLYIATKHACLNFFEE